MNCALNISKAKLITDFFFFFGTVGRKEINASVVSSYIFNMYLSRFVHAERNKVKYMYILIK